MRTAFLCGFCTICNFLLQNIIYYCVKSSNVHFLTVGEGSVTYVFLHGWGCDSSQFLPVAKHLTNAKCYLLDLWGFGRTPSPDEAWDSHDYALRLHMFFVEHNIKKAVVVGHSFGGRVALSFAEAYPKRVQKLVLVASAGLRRVCLKRTAKVALHKVKKLLVRLHVIKTYTPTGSADYNAVSSKMKPTFLKIVRENLTRVAKNVNTSTLLVYGNSDKETPLWMAKRFNKYIADSVLITVEGGHFAFFCQPENSAKMLTEFVGAK